MKQLGVSLILLLTVISGVFGQKELSDYAYVVVPDRFDFLSEDDQYQLNSMTKYYLEQKGFNVFYFGELPNVKKCDGLWADVENKSNFTRTKMTIVVKDCKGAELYRSSQGISKHKEYRKSYQEALRNALNSVEKLPNKQKEIVITDSVEPDPETGKSALKAEKKLQPKEVVTVNVAVTKQFPPQNKFNSYIYENDSYLLKKIENGFNVYKVSDTSETGLELKGAIVKNSSGYSAIVFETQYQCFFKENQDVMLVDSKEGSSGITLKFQN